MWKWDGVTKIEVCVHVCKGGGGGVFAAIMNKVVFCDATYDVGVIKPMSTR